MIKIFGMLKNESEPQVLTPTVPIIKVMIDWITTKFALFEYWRFLKFKTRGLRVFSNVAD